MKHEDLEKRAVEFYEKLPTDKDKKEFIELLKEITEKTYMHGYIDATHNAIVLSQNPNITSKLLDYVSKQTRRFENYLKK